MAPALIRGMILRDNDGFTLPETNLITLQGTNISQKNGILKMIFLFPRWDMLIPWRVAPENGCFGRRNPADPFWGNALF